MNSARIHDHGGFVTITKVHFSGLRTLEDVYLDLPGFNVLIGDNGAGKSTVLEGLQLLHLMAEPDFMQAFNTIHGGINQLLTVGWNQMTLALEINTGQGPLTYLVTFGRRDYFPVIECEFLVKAPIHSARNVAEKDYLITREGSRRMVRHKESSDQLVSVSVDGIGPDRLLLSAFGDSTRSVPNEGFLPMLEALRGIRVRVPFGVLPLWVARGTQMKSPLREPQLLQRAESLDQLGTNLASALHGLKNSSTDSWEEFMDLVRLGLGQDVDTINSSPYPEGGTLGIGLRLKGWDKDILASQMSDGQLAYIAFVVLTQMTDDVTLLAFDEPESHLHPELLMRVLGMFESLARKLPVVLATHSDRLLDGLSAPAEAAVLCSLDSRRSTKLLRPDGPTLARWLERYRGLGELRSEGYSPFTRS